MSKVFIKIVVFLSIYFNSYSQTKILPISGDINTLSSEINFLKISDSTAFFTSIFYNDKFYSSKIFRATKSNNNWNKIYSHDYNLSNFSTGNITISHDGDLLFYSRCNIDNSDCNIMLTKKNITYNLTDIYPEIFSGSHNTQPHVFTIRDRRFLCFVSDRDGGFGGLDIWFSIIDNSDKLGSPLNAGPKVNTEYHEITPYYNSFDSALYFSSNQIINNLGGYDIYSINGVPNNWSNRINKNLFNSINDDMYLIFYTENKGYFSSNRSSLFIENSDSCCNNIYSFSVSITNTDTVEPPTYSEFLPLNLYFDNNQPNPYDTITSNTQSYKETYVNYFMRLDDYPLYNDDPRLTLFFEDSLKGNYNQLNQLLDKLVTDLNSGYKINIQIKGYTSQLADSIYNIQLSSLRIRTLIRYLSSYNNGVMNDFIVSNQLKVLEVPLGESESINTISQNPLLQIYGLEAMLNRKVSIIKIQSYK